MSHTSTKHIDHLFYPVITTKDTQLHRHDTEYNVRLVRTNRKETYFDFVLIPKYK